MGEKTYTKLGDRRKISAMVEQVDPGLVEEGSNF